MMKKLVVIGGIAAVAGLGIGGVALADSHSSAPAAVAVAQGSTAGVVAAPAAVTTSAGTAKPGDKSKAGKTRAGDRHGIAKRLEKVAHAQWVSKDGKTGTFVTHDAIRGGVTAVSGTSITIKSADGTSETFAVNGTTKVHVRGAAGVKGAAKTPGSISEVKVGDQVGVLGTGAGTMTATRVVDRGVAGAHKSAHKSKTATPTTSAPATS